MVAFPALRMIFFHEWSRCLFSSLFTFFLKLSERLLDGRSVCASPTRVLLVFFSPRLTPFLLPGVCAFVYVCV